MRRDVLEAMANDILRGGAKGPTSEMGAECYQTNGDVDGQIARRKDKQRSDDAFLKAARKARGPRAMSLGPRAKYALTKAAHPDWLLPMPRGVPFTLVPRKEQDR